MHIMTGVLLRLKYWNYLKLVQNIYGPAASCSMLNKQEANNLQQNVPYLKRAFEM